MGNLWLKIKVWSKVTLFALLFIYLIFFILQNTARPVQVWFFFYREPTTNVLFLAVCAFLAGVLSTIFWQTTRTTLRQLRDLRERQRVERLERMERDMQAKAAMVRTKPPGEPETPAPEADTTTRGA